MTPSVLTIAGSDPSGGAGIQADLRVFNALGLAGLSAVTAVTVQNGLGMHAVHPIPAETVAAQIHAILSTTPVRAVKIGMLANAAQVAAVASTLKRFKAPNVVLDPVLASSTGFVFLDDSGVNVLVTKLLPSVDLVTPNLSEAGTLAGMAVTSDQRMLSAAIRIRSLGAKNVLVKGGHLQGKPMDLLLDQSGRYTQLAHRYRIHTPNTHGTGCFLSSAIAACLAAKLPMSHAVAWGQRLIADALSQPIVAGRGRGYPALNVTERSYTAHVIRRRLARARLSGIYVVATQFPGSTEPLGDIIESCLAGGACAVQLREKKLTDSLALEAAEHLGRRATLHDALSFMNDRADLVLAAKLDGVHLGPDDLSPKRVRLILGREKLIGVSVNSVEEARTAAAIASYFGVGAIYGSQTKLDAGDPIGLDAIAGIKSAYPNHPIVAIGGINKDNLLDVRDAGADCAAVSSAVCNADDPEAATRELVDLWYS